MHIEIFGSIDHVTAKEMINHFVNDLAATGITREKVELFKQKNILTP